jgi:hypothetical protein
VAGCAASAALSSKFFCGEASPVTPFGYKKNTGVFIPYDKSKCQPLVEKRYKKIGGLMAF